MQVNMSFLIFIFQDIALESSPLLIGFSEQMQAIIAVIWVHVLGFRSHELREEVDVGQATSVGDVLDQGVWAMASAFCFLASC